jgi:hypothetical protein
MKNLMIKKAHVNNPGCQPRVKQNKNKWVLAGQILIKPYNELKR